MSSRSFCFALGDLEDGVFVAEDGMEVFNEFGKDSAFVEIDVAE